MTEKMLSITTLAKEFDITSRTLRHYEEFGLLSPSRDGTVRWYSYRDKVRLKLILRGKRIGFSLGEIKEILDIYDLPEGEQKQTSFLMEKITNRRNSLIEQQKDINGMLKELDDIEKKINRN